MADGSGLKQLIDNARETPYTSCERLINCLSESTERLLSGEGSKRVGLLKELKDLWLLVLCRTKPACENHWENALQSLIGLVSHKKEPSRLSSAESLSKERILARCILQLCVSEVNSSKICSQFLQLITMATNNEGLSCSLAMECCLTGCASQENKSTLCFYLAEIVSSGTSKRKIKQACLQALHCQLVSAPEGMLWMGESEASRVSKCLAHWILLPKYSMHSSRRSPAGKVTSQEDVTVSELDGVISRDLFTVLNLAQHYSGQHMLNMISFSFLKYWIMELSHLQFKNVLDKDYESPRRQATSSPVAMGKSVFYDQGSVSTNSSPGNSSLASSISSSSSFFVTEDAKVDLDDSQSRSQERRLSTMSSISTLSLTGRDTPTQLPLPASGHASLLTSAVRYCIRIINQADRIPQKSQDKAVLCAAVVEAISILDALCHEDESLYHKVIAKIKQLCLRVSANATDFRQVYVSLIQFHINHASPLVSETEDLLSGYLKDIPAKLYFSSSCSFECLELCLKNKEFLSSTCPLLSKYFPNIFKMFVWHPRTFIGELLELLPYMFDARTLVEFFHSLLDFPCILACLKIQRSKSAPNKAGSQGGGDSLQTLLVNFMLRSESGSGETVDKLSSLHDYLEPFLTDPQVMLCSQVTPLLLKKYFTKVLTVKSEDYYNRLFPTLLERVFHVYASSQYKAGIEILLSHNAVELVKVCPRLLSDFKDDVLGALNRVRGSPTKHTLIGTNLIWMIGEMAVASESCSSGQVMKYYETLETMLYEAAAVINQSVSIPAQMLSTLLSAVAKLAGYNQDLIPRAHLALTKLCANLDSMQQSVSYSGEEIQFLSLKGHELIQILQLPNVASFVLSSSTEHETWHLDKNNSVKMKIHNAVCHISAI